MVQFREWESVQTCSFLVRDDKRFEGAEKAIVALEKPVMALLGRRTEAAVRITDNEDGEIYNVDKKVMIRSQPLPRLDGLKCVSSSML